MFEDLYRLVLFAYLADRYRDNGWVLVDNDDAGRQAIEKLKERFPKWPSENFSMFDKPCFELYYPNRFDEDRSALDGESDWRRRLEIKGKMAEDLCQWVRDDPNAALPQIESSAAGAIAALRRIEESVSRRMAPQVSA